MMMHDLTETEYDKEEFKRFLAGHCLPKLKGKSGVLVLGPKGAGKSTTIAIQLGAVYDKDPGGRGYKLISSGTYTPQTSDGFISKTLNIGSYEDLETHVMYLDTAGVNEDRSKEAKLWTENSLSLLFSIIKELRSVVVVMNYGETFSGRADGCGELAEKISKITMGEDVFYRSMIFVVTDGYERGDRVTVPKFLERAGEKLAASSKLKEALIKRLERAYPLPMTQRFARRAVAVAAATVGMTSTDGDASEITFDFDKVPEEDKRQLCMLQATEALLKAFIEPLQRGQEPGSRVVLSYPDGELACQRLRIELFQKIRVSPIVTRDMLVHIKESHMVDSSLLLLNILSSLASSYARNLSQEADLLTGLARSYQEKSELLEAVARDWVSVKESLVRIKERSIVDKKTELGAKEEELDRLQKSTTEMVHREEQVLKERNAGFLHVRWLFGKSRAVSQYTYNDQPFIRYEYVFNPEVSRFEAAPIEDRDKGKLTINFTSHNGYDLNLKVRIFVQEKDLPATKERVRLLEQEIKGKKEELALLDSSLTYLRAIQSKEHLEEEITKEANTLRDGLRRVMHIFETPLSESGEDTDWHAVKGLEALFDLLVEVKAVHRNLSPASKNTMEEFLRYCKAIETASDNPYLKRLMPDVAVVQHVVDTARREAAPPTECRGALTRAGVLVSNAIRDFGSFLGPNFFRNHQFEFGICTVLLGVLTWYESLSDTDSSQFSVTHTSAMFAITTGVFMTLSYLRTSLGGFFTDVGRITAANARQFQSQLKEVVDEMEIEARKTAMTARDCGIFATRKLSEKFNVDIRTDIRGNLRTLADISGIRL